MNAQRSAATTTGFVLIVWLAMAVAAGVYVMRYGCAIPFSDDLEMIRPSCPGAAVRAQWLWSQHNEHRVPIARLVYVGAMRLFHDPRAVMLCQVGLLAGLSLAMILAVRSIRGTTRASDVFFPLLWLHCGNAQNLLTAFQVALILPVAVVGTMLILVCVGSPVPGTKRSLLLGACACLLPFTGGHGISQAPTLFAWLGVAGILGMRSKDPGERSSGRTLVIGTALALLLVGAYFVAFVPFWGTLTSRDPARTLTVGAQFLSLALGPAGERIWPWSLPIVAGVCFAAGLTLWSAFRSRPAERVRVAGILAVFGGVAIMTLTVGWARGGFVWGGFANRYVSLPSMALCCAYFTWCLYGPRSFQRLWTWALGAVMLGALVANTQYGIRYGEYRRRVADSFEAGLARGTSIHDLAVTHAEDFYCSGSDVFERVLNDLQRAGLPPFDGGPDPRR